jgi:hypothetical protein
MFGEMYVTYQAGHTATGNRQRRPRKIQLDRNVFIPHSVRESGGDSDCDHDFESTPTIREPDFAIWKCTRCGREFKYETWKSTDTDKSKRKRVPLR